MPDSTSTPDPRSPLALLLARLALLPRFDPSRGTSAHQGDIPEVLEANAAWQRVRDRLSHAEKKALYKHPNWLNLLALKRHRSKALERKKAKNKQEYILRTLTPEGKAAEALKSKSARARRWFKEHRDELALQVAEHGDPCPAVMERIAAKFPDPVEAEQRYAEVVLRWMLGTKCSESRLTELAIRAGFDPEEILERYRAGLMTPVDPFAEILEAT